MIDIALDKDEIFPYFVADEDYITPEYHDAIVHVEKGWWEEYSMVRAKFWDMQDELASLYYGKNGLDLIEEALERDCE